MQEFVALMYKTTAMPIFMELAWDKSVRISRAQELVVLLLQIYPIKHLLFPQQMEVLLFQ